MMGYRKLELLIWVLSVLCLACFSSGFNPVDNYLIDCGSSTNTSVGVRVFLADNLGSNFLSTSQEVLANTTSSTVSPLYQTARVFTGPSKYTFSIRQSGRHWIRLYFYPFGYNSYNMSAANFAVSTQSHTLLSNFNPGNTDVVKEFSENVTSNTLVITFTPSANSIAFLNAIEVVSVPDGLIRDVAGTVDSTGTFHGLLALALETVWRVNMGGPTVISDNDTLWRTWVPDQSFLVQENLATNLTNIAAVKYVQGGATQDTAPNAVYGSLTEMNSDATPGFRYFNVTWEFNVDPGFQYLVRFHFCDLVSTGLDELYFNVYIDSWIVVKDLELSTLLLALAAPYSTDFVTPLTVSNTLRVMIGPSPVKGNYPNAILNGLEIMKINNSIGKGSKQNVGVIVGVSVGVFISVVLVGILFMLSRGRRKLALQRHSRPTQIPLSIDEGNSHSMGNNFSNGTTTNAAYRFTFVAVQEATNNFDESQVIGIGGFGKVYKGVLKDGTKVAVKRGNPQYKQGLKEFQNEIELLSEFRHRHLVLLIGYCEENNEMILVYEYMENGTLKSHLYGSDLPSLSWKERLEICIGAAKGLHYLHTGYEKAVIHRDVKSANILLDENLMVKVADFGLSKTKPEIDQSHVSTAVRGSFGYLDPEYFKRKQLTEKSDVYSLGMVLFEVVCGRPVIDTSLPSEMVNLNEWAIEWQKKGQLEQIIDPTLVGIVRPESLRKFGEIAEKCLSDSRVDRPSMGDVLRNLKLSLQLQEAVIQGNP